MRKFLDTAKMNLIKNIFNYKNKTKNLVYLVRTLNLLVS